ncbi:MAG TPA: DMT family transporter [Gemmatimonadaceae bacterium]
MIRITTGVRHMLVGAFWFSVMSVLVKLAGQRLPSMEIVFFRGLLTLAMSYAIVKRARIEPVLGVNRRLLLQRGILGAAALACFLFSLTHLPLAESTLIQYMNPVFAILVAHWWFGERMVRGEWFAMAASLIGVLLITRPAFLFGGAASGIHPGHALIALMGAAFSGSAYATIRQMPKERPEVVVLYLPLMSVPMSLPFIASNWHMPTPIEWVLLIGIGGATQLAQVSMTKGLQVEKTARATMVGYVQIIFAGAWGALLFGESITTWTVVGAAIVLVGMLSLVVVHNEPVSIDE